MKVIGVTGGVGAGKSMVLEILEKEYGARILSADGIGRELMEPGGICFAPVAEAFGNEVIKEDGRLNRGKIAELVFGNEEALGRLNGIVHPAVRQEIETRLKTFEQESVKNKGEQVVVIESAILLEAGYEEICEEIWYVYASEEIRIGRLMESRGYSRERCLRVMENQMGETEFRDRAAVVIENSGSREQTEKQIEKRMKICQ